MEGLWKLAFSLTGISGVGAFVLYSLYKDWLRVPLLVDLTRDQKYKLSCLFLMLTSFFVICAFALHAFQRSLEVRTTAVSVHELQSIIETRYKSGERTFLDLKTKKGITEDDLNAVNSIEREYKELTKEALEALKKNQLVKFHEITNKLNKLLNSKKAKKVLKDIDVNDMCLDPRSPILQGDEA